MKKINSYHFNHIKYKFKHKKKINIIILYKNYNQILINNRKSNKKKLFIIFIIQKFKNKNIYRIDIHSFINQHQSNR